MIGFIIGIVSLNLIIWVVLLPYMIQAKISTFQNSLVDKYYDEVENMYRTMRMWKHDYHNHIQTMMAYLSLNQIEEIDKYLHDMQVEMAVMDNILRTGNIKADAILNSKIALMKHYEINVDATAIMPATILMTGTELSVLIGNILDNAIEACLKIEDKDKRFIRIYIDIFKEQLYINVTNSMQGKARMIAGIYVSSKKTTHGFGLMSIDRIVKKYEGYINRKCEEDVFATEIMIPLR